MASLALTDDKKQIVVSISLGLPRIVEGYTRDGVDFHVSPRGLEADELEPAKAAMRRDVQLQLQEFVALKAQLV